MALEGFFCYLLSRCNQEMYRKSTTSKFSTGIWIELVFYLSALKKKIIKSHCCPLTRSSLNALWFSFRFTTFPSRFLKENPVKCVLWQTNKQTNISQQRDTYSWRRCAVERADVDVHHATVKRVVEKWSVICVPNTKSVPRVWGLATP